ncbi:2'-5' RNA ligase family protein [Nocardioides stalactiti]|uniref:2'-5' RNA ligase family protein n=1 Tax=Nocardioides stalactiti TaxID=2755356 RepID=UPI001603052F|nr:2'-5' RNA ligase family protein [Nocardioides stalactiti]
MLIRAALVPPEEALEELEVATRVLRSIPGVVSVSPEQLEIPITAFGNLQPPDCERLAGLLRNAFEGADAPVVWFHGLRLEEGATIALGMAGDVEPIADLARYVPEAAEKLRLYVDRRRFRPHIRFATAEPDTSVALLQSALGAVADWSGTPWAVPGLSLLRTRWLQGNKTAEEYDLIAMA